MRHVLKVIRLEFFSRDGFPHVRIALIADDEVREASVCAVTETEMNSRNITILLEDEENDAVFPN